MKYAYMQVKINAPFPIKPCGHLTQTKKLSTYHDDLHARILYLEDKFPIIHISFDLLGIQAEFRNKLQKLAQEMFERTDLVLISASTHTHYGNDILNIEYQQYLYERIKQGLSQLMIQDYDDMKVSYQNIFYDQLGKSRITNYESSKEYLSLISLYIKDELKLVWIHHNVHPTILSSEINYFSSEYPGYVIQKLKGLYPNIDFTFSTGPSGDISSRFTRDGQDYDALMKLADPFIETIISLMNENKQLYPLTLQYEEKIIPYIHDLSPLDESKIPKNLSEREQLSLQYGILLRQQVIESKDVDPNAHIGCLTLNKYKIIFFPNEIFSAYLEAINIEDTILDSYSNGYGPYVLPIDFPYMCYEMFMDTLTPSTKQDIYQTFQYYSNK